MVNWNNEGGSVFLIMFKTRHALPLVKTMFSCPRIGRGEGRGWLRDMHRSWPQTRSFHELEQPTHRARQRIFHVCVRFVSAFKPWEQPSSQIFRICDYAMTATVLAQASAMDINCPLTIHGLDPFTPANPSRTRIRHKLQLAKNSLRCCNVPSASWPAIFPARIQIIPNHEYV